MLILTFFFQSRKNVSQPNINAEIILKQSSRISYTFPPEVHIFQSNRNSMYCNLNEIDATASLPDEYTGRETEMATVCHVVGPMGH